MRFVDGRRTFRPEQDRDATPPGDGPGDRLVAERRERSRRRPHEDQPLLGTTGSKARLLAEEAVSGVHRGATRTHRDVDDLLGIEVRRRASTAQRDGRVGAAHGERVGVVLGVDGHGAHAEVGGGPDDPDCHLSSVRDEDAGPGFERGPHRSRGSGGGDRGG